MEDMKFKNRTIDIMGVKYNIKHLSEKEIREVAGRPKKRSLPDSVVFIQKKF